MNERLDRGGDREDRSQQPVAYVISAVEGVVDVSTVKRYAELAGPAIEYFGGRFIVSNTKPVVVEGESPSNHLSMVEFPSMEDAKAWYNSPEYAEARDLTPAAFRGRLLIFAEGVKTKTAQYGSLTTTIQNRVHVSRDRHHVVRVLGNDMFPVTLKPSSVPVILSFPEPTEFRSHRCHRRRGSSGGAGSGALQ